MNQKKKFGGRQPGAGRPKGTSAILAEKMREQYTKRAFSQADKLYEAQSALAFGHQVVSEDGKMVYLKSPDGNMVRYMLDQIIGKPQQRMTVEAGVELSLDI